MKTTFLQAVRLTLICLIVFTGAYTILIWGIAQTAPDSGKGEKIAGKGKIFYANVGQSFTENKWFNSRPSAVGYNAAGSGGSNKGPSNAEYLAEVQKRIDTFLLLNPGVKNHDIPADLVTASGSGLDPDISVKAANAQVKRVAKAREIPEERLYELIAQNTEKPLGGLFGPEKINVLKLNLALSTLK